ncbi:Na(+)-translocating NADH-quinone reductase subunit C [bacterium]|nr:Na(+)-translocating NADH-quinone reductase subunit C [bacterium]
MQRDSNTQTMIVAACLCLVCSVLVSTAAVVLRPTQQENKTLDIQRNILKVAGVFDENKSVASQFAAVKPQLIWLEKGTVVTAADAKYEKLDLKTYDPRKAAKQPEFSDPVEPPGALPQISRRERFAFVYQLKKEDGSLDQIILPIYGKGLWSTLYGFLAIDADLETIRGITFYEHGETPGLGGEVDNPAWKAKWNGKKAFGSDGRTPVIAVAKGASGDHQIDALSGATITSNGVTDLVQYWLGPDGFGPYLAHLRAAGPQAADSSQSTSNEGDTNG